MTQKVYREGFQELWIGLKLASDAELMFTQIGFEAIAYGSFTAAARQATTDDFLATVAVEMKDCLPSDWTLQEGFCLWGRWDSTGTPVPPIVVPSTNAPVAGTRGPGGSAVQNTAVLVHKSVPYGRSGRMFWPGVSEAAVSPNGTLDGSELTLWQTTIHAWEILLEATLDEDSGFLAMQSQFAAGDAYTTTKPVTSLVVDGVVATQRRRLRR